MKHNFHNHLNGLIMSMAFIVVGCTKGVHGGDPALPLSTTNGTTIVFIAPENKVLTAISNALAMNDGNPQGYRGMMLSDASDYPGPNRQYPNGYALTPVVGPITNVPLTGGASMTVPYIACFNITTKPFSGTNTAVTVRTFLSQVIDGKQSPIQGGWAHNYRDVPPVKVEEENVLNAISNALVALHEQN